MCNLRDEAVARMVQTALLHFDGLRYRLIAWVVMPNHVHVLIETIPGHALSDIIHSSKSFTAKAANRILKRTGVFWEQEYFDRVIRDENHFWNAVSYIQENPVKAGLVPLAAAWPYSSAVGTGGTPALPAGGTPDGVPGEPE
jgi:putative DNA methylase